MTAIEHIQAAQQGQLTDEDGKAVSLELLPPLAPDKIDALQSAVRITLPEELRSLLAFCSGIEGVLNQVDFTGENLMFEMEDIFPHGLPIAGDGFGNFWVLDITPDACAAAPVFFACHDAPLVLYQSPDIATFLAELFKAYVPPHKSLFADIHEDRVFQVWRRNPGVIDHQAAITSSDPALKAFATQLSSEFQFIDLRNVEPGMGFSWGRYGPRTELRRHGYERLFAYAKPAKTGFLSKLFGR